MKCGQEVVVMHVYVDGPLAPGGIPCEHNSKHSLEHPCRGIILKVGRKWIHVQSTGPNVKAAAYVPNTTGWFAVPVDEAKRLYRLGLESRPAYRTQAFIDKCVNSL